MLPVKPGLLVFLAHAMLESLMMVITSPTRLSEGQVETGCQHVKRTPTSQLRRDTLALLWAVAEPPRATHVHTKSHRGANILGA